MSSHKGPLTPSLSPPLSSPLPSAAAAYLVDDRRADGGGVGVLLVDAPPCTPDLRAAVDARFGGVDAMLLTSAYHAGDHEAWKAAYPDMQRLMHRFDVRPATRAVEERLDGDGPWPLGPSMVAYNTPGPSYGALTVHHKPSEALLTGGLLAYVKRALLPLLLLLVPVLVLRPHSLAVAAAATATATATPAPPLQRWLLLFLLTN